MIPNEDQIQFIAQMSKGDLAEVSFPVLLHALAVQKRSVVLSIERRQLKKEIILENGIPVDCQSNLLQDTLGRFMADRGDITDEQCQLSLSKSATSGAPVSEVLVAEGWVRAEKMFRILQQNLAKKLLDAFTWKTGDFAVSTQLPAVDSPLKVKTPQLVLTGVTKFAPSEEVEQAMQPFLETKLFLNPSPPYPLSELRLSQAQQQLVSAIESGGSVADIGQQIGSDRSNVLRTLYALAIIGTVVPEAWLPADRGGPQTVELAVDTDMLAFASESPPAAPTVTSEPETEHEPGERVEPDVASKIDVAERRNEVMEYYLRHRKQDCFDLLGVSEDVGLAGVEDAYIRYCERFGPWHYVGELQNMHDKARDLFIAGGKAFGELMNPETRNSAIARRNNKLKELGSEEARNAFKIKSDLLDAETQFKRGLALMQAQKYADAIEQLAFAYDCEPQNSVYRSELAYCRYRKDPSLEKERSESELRETIRIEPDCGLALYYLGVLVAETGDFDDAEIFLQKAIKLMRPDRRPIDALKVYKSQAKDKSKKRRFF